MQNNVIDYLNEIVKTKPDKIAYANENEEYTFKEVLRYSRSIATFLAQKGIYHEPVVIFMRKHPKEIISFLGTITAGNYYVPIDEEMPLARIKLILDNVKTKVIICDENTKQMAQDLLKEGLVVTFDDISENNIDDDILFNIHEKVIDTDPIYIVFTSGSTGTPKGVAACHRSVIDYIEQLSDVLEFDENTVFGNQTPLYFDACLKEIYPTIKFGATTYLIPKSMFIMPIKLVEFLNKYKINTICWVVSALTMISSFGTFRKIKPEYLRNIAFGSEVFPIKQFNIWKEAVPDARFTNLYGPTEGTGMCCYYKVNKEFKPDEVIPIGHPFKNTDILLLKDRKEKAAQGEVGEICIRGTSVTLGYYNNPQKTAESYIQNPLNHFFQETIYCTGDLGKYNDDGELIFVSRKDYQIKHMGHRIELGEIETNVNMLENIKFSCCVYDEGHGKIVLYYVGNIAEKDVIAGLKDMLPRYMIPNMVIRLEKMPMTANGKIDRVSLKNMCKEN